MSVISSDYYNSIGLGAAAGSAAEKSSSDSIGQADFLLLMTTQLQNQDPLNPMDNAEMVSQLAQMSTVQGIQDLNTTVSGFSSSLTNDQLLRGTALVGRNVVVPSSSWALEETGSTNGLIAASGPGQLNVEITDSSGRVVANTTATATAAGELAFSWDGTGNNGQRLPAGKYSLSATFTPTDGAAEAAQTFIQAPVDSVTIGTDGLYLNLKNLGVTSLDQVLRVS